MPHSKSFGTKQTLQTSVKKMGNPKLTTFFYFALQELIIENLRVKEN